MRPQIIYNTEKAFSLKSYKDLKRTRWLFKMMNSPFIVKMMSGLVNFGIKIGLPIDGAIKATIFKQFVGGETLSESKKVVDTLYKANVKTILDFSIEGEETNEAFDKTLIELQKIIQYAHNNPAIPYTCIKLTGLVSTELLHKMSDNTKLTEMESADWNLFLKRMDKLFDDASAQNVPIYIDAEESWIQIIIDKLAEEYMLKYNKGKTIVLTTLQMYRHDRLDYLKNLIAFARKNNIMLGVKLVRGAYIEKENLRAKTNGYPTPIQPSKEKTDQDFNKALSLCLENIDIIMLCAGTHNEESSVFLLEEMKRLGIPNNHKHIFYSQLFGMSDHISMNLAAEGYNVTKYLPYGPVKSVIPYLIRRANENTSIAGQMSRELDLITQEKTRRDKLKLLK